MVLVVVVIVLVVVTVGFLMRRTSLWNGPVRVGIAYSLLPGHFRGMLLLQFFLLLGIPVTHECFLL
ncbi:hypothetical protein EBZ80_04800 [bacterium]|nr:hypothetical protein [bacterium]